MYLCMYISIFICICMYVYLYPYLYVYTYMHIHIYILTYRTCVVSDVGDLYTWGSTVEKGVLSLGPGNYQPIPKLVRGMYIYIFIYTYVYICICICICIHIPTRIHWNMYLYICINIHICTYICTCRGKTGSLCGGRGWLYVSINIRYYTHSSIWSFIILSIEV
jgi:hypothetical protein